MESQASCGHRPVFDDKCSMRRNSVPVEPGFAPFHANIVDQEHGENDGHVGNGVLLSSCWLIASSDSFKMESNSIKDFDTDDIETLRVILGSYASNGYSNFVH